MEELRDTRHFKLELYKLRARNLDLDNVLIWIGWNDLYG